jgi:hypothetical protein
MVNRPVGERPLGVPLPGRVFQGPEERPVNVMAVTSGFQVLVEALGGLSGWAGT